MNQRPKLENRNFVSFAVEEKISEIKDCIRDKELAELFENCYPNTLDTTVYFDSKDGRPDTFVITGDINAMWLRDSTAQVWPYLPLADKDKKLKDMLKGVIIRQTKCILIDPYANAFCKDKEVSPWNNDITEMKPGIYERKWELDSLCYFIRLSYGFWKETGDVSCYGENWRSAAKLILQTFREQQHKSNRGTYRFGRITSWSTDTVPGNGYGNPVMPNGLIVTIFRPSDDAAIFPFNIPSNFFAVVSLEQLARMSDKILNDREFAAECLTLASEIKKALKEYTSANHLTYGEIFAYEIDGFGNKIFMDDANIPSLLSLPYLGCCNIDDPIYLNTRKFLLSSSNPYFFQGKEANGIGSPHTLIDSIWPMSIIMQALTSTNKDEIVQCLTFLKYTSAATGFMHESFNKNDKDNFTRNWFAWANSLFGELIVKIFNEQPDILLNNFT